MAKTTVFFSPQLITAQLITIGSIKDTFAEFRNLRNLTHKQNTSHYQSVN